MDVSQVPLGVNANIYVVTPKFSGGSTSPFSPTKDYCDGAVGSTNWCVEVDFIESNGNCGGQSTLHTIPNQWCMIDYPYHGISSFAMNMSFDSQGHWTISYNGITYQWNQLQPTPQQKDLDNLSSYFKNQGAVIISTQWVGWVPTPTGCSGQNGTLDNAFYAISNVKISGTVVQGPTPRLC